VPGVQGMFVANLLENRVLLVTGGGSGLGESMAASFCRLGGLVAILGRNEERLGAALPRIDPSGERSFAVVADVRNAGAVDEAVARITARFGRIDVLVNNAAGNFLAATEELSPNGFDAIVRTVLHGTFHCTRAVAPQMLDRRSGVILNIVATYAWTGSAFVVPSAAAKAGVLAMTRSLAVEWADRGVRVNAIAPGPFPTEGAWSRLMPTPESEAHALGRGPAGRFGHHEELCNLAVFLVSDAAPYITGEVVTIDGGEWLASGGQFSGLAKVPGADLKELMKRAR